jgi:hypothetical protein
MKEWVWSISRVILIAGQTEAVGRKSVLVPLCFPQTWHLHGTEPGLYCDRLVTKYASHGTALKCYMNIIYVLIHFMCTDEHNFPKNCYSSKILGLVSPSYVCAFHILQERSDSMDQTDT